MLLDIPWFFGGDFNMVESQDDKMGAILSDGRIWRMCIGLNLLILRICLICLPTIRMLILEYGTLGAIFSKGTLGSIQD